MSRETEYKGKRNGNLELAEQSLFSENGVNDDELAEMLDYEISEKAAVLWCRRQDARKFKREQSVKKGAFIFSIPVEGEEKPRYFALEVIKQNRPKDKQILRRRSMRSLENNINLLVEVALVEDAQGTLFDLEDLESELIQIVREMLRNAVNRKGVKKIA